MSRRVTPNVTPFIPPLHTPEAPQPPVVPSPGGAMPGWASLPQNPNNYPAYGTYPPTPYTANTPFIPNMSAHPTPAVPGAYLPGSAPPSAGPQHNGLSLDYSGYPNFGTPWAAQANLAPPAQWGVPQAGPPPGTPWPAPQAGPPPGTPWMGGGGYTPFQGPPGGLHPGMQMGGGRMGGGQMGPPPGPPMGGGYMGPPMGGPQMGGPQMGGPQMGPPPLGGPGGGWGAPMGPGAFTPAGGYADMWGGGAPAVPGWAGQGQPQQQVPLSRAIGQVGDRVNPFAAGAHYGPVLEPFLVRTVNAQVSINPLLQPPPDDGVRPHLKWNMLFQSNYCQRSTDPTHISWSNGRNEPATFPRVSNLRILSKTFPWMITIKAHQPNIGVTCGEVIDTISANMMRLSSGSEYTALPRLKQKTVGESYRRNRGRAHGVPGGQLGEGIRRLDWLGLDTMYGGIERNDRLVKELCGDVLPCTFELKCIHRYALTEQEIREHEARDRAIREQRRSRATVSSEDTEEDEDEDN